MTKWTQTPAVSVIIPTYNRAEMLVRALESVGAQTFRDFELIVVDDGSSDHSAEVVAAFQKRQSGDFRMKYIHRENRGVAASRNEGVRQAAGAWIAFLDSDDEWIVDKLEKQWQWAQAHPEIALIHSEEIWVRDGRRVNPPERYKKRGGWIFLHSLEVCSISPSTVFIKKEEFERCGGFDENFPVCEDYHLWLRMTLRQPVGLVETPTIIKYGGHLDQLSYREKAMDFYRVLAIDGILKEDFGIEEWKIRAREVLLKKCDILLRGYEKHDNMENHSRIALIKERWLQ